MSRNYYKRVEKEGEQTSPYENPPGWCYPFGDGIITGAMFMQVVFGTVATNFSMYQFAPLVCFFVVLLAFYVLRFVRSLNYKNRLTTDKVLINVLLGVHVMYMLNFVTTVISYVVIELTHKTVSFEYHNFMSYGDFIVMYVQLTGIIQVVHIFAFDCTFFDGHWDTVVEFMLNCVDIFTLLYAVMPGGQIIQNYNPLVAAIFSFIILAMLTNSYQLMTNVCFGEHDSAEHLHLSGAVLGICLQEVPFIVLRALMWKNGFTQNALFFFFKNGVFLISYLGTFFKIIAGTHPSQNRLEQVNINISSSSFGTV